MSCFSHGCSFAAMTLVVAAAVSSCAASYPAESESDITDFLADCGISVAGAPTRKTVTIPPEFGEVYERYNELQKEQGFDLTRYRSREAEVYTFSVVSADHERPGLTEAHVMVCDGVVIGGDISSPALGGDMRPLIVR